MKINKGKMNLKPLLYSVTAIFLGVCVYAFIQYVPISYKTVPYSVEQTDGPLKKAIDKRSTLLSDIEAFWSKYTIWGDTDTVYRSADHNPADNPSLESDEAEDKNTEKKYGL